jgi:D-beta-D-heptose 7-phosphate kinase/D-beta-D-heptose 1-phosphate adenosyltransferase
MVKVWVNGTFDVLHLGHVKLLQHAASLGELLVGVDADERVKQLKGTTRPFNKLEERIEMLKSLKCVNEVVSFHTDEELKKHIETWKTDIMVKGGDWKGGEIIGKELVKNIIYFNMVEGKSTTKILSYDKANSL